MARAAGQAQAQAQAVARPADDARGRRARLGFSKRRGSASASASDTEIVADELQPRKRAGDAVTDLAAISPATLSSQLMWRLAMRMSLYNESRLLQHLSRSILSRSAHRHSDRKSQVEERSFFTQPADVPPTPTPSSSSTASTASSAASVYKQAAGISKLLAFTSSHADPDGADSPEKCGGLAKPRLTRACSTDCAKMTIQPLATLATQPFTPAVPPPALKTQKRARGMTLREYVNWEYAGIRPGLSIRVVRAEIVGSMPAITEYALHVVDLHTKVFWITKKRSSELYMLRRKIRGIVRHSTTGSEDEQEMLRYLLDLPFPRRRFRSPSTESLGRDMSDIELFLRNVAALEPSSELQRSILHELQLELCSPEFITSLEHIDTSGEPPAPKWIAYDLFRALNSVVTPEGNTCYKFLSAFANRCAVIQAAVCPMCHAFEDTALSADALRDLRTMVTSIEKYMLEHMDSQYPDELSVSDQSVNVQSIIEDCVFHAVEDTILVPLEKQIAFLVGSTVDPKVEARLAANIEKMRNRSQSECGIPEHLQSGDNWGLSCHHMSMIDERSLPVDKIQELLRAAGDIFKSHDEKNLEWCQNSTLSADDYLPINIYVVVNSGLKRPLMAKELLVAMIHPSQMLGEVGYILTMFEVALKYIADM